jgi:hypothetical protein
MKPVDMTVLPSPDTVGDCFRCCIASILELRADEVPHFYESRSESIATKLIQDWLEPRGFRFLQIGLETNSYFILEDYLKFHHTVTGKSPRNQGLYHSVVGFGPEIVHDPHPSRAGIIHDDGIFIVGILCKI